MLFKKIPELISLNSITLSDQMVAYNTTSHQTGKITFNDLCTLLHNGGGFLNNTDTVPANMVSINGTSVLGTSATNVSDALSQTSLTKWGTLSETVSNDVPSYWSAKSAGWG